MSCIVIFEVTAKKGTGTQLVEAFRSILPVTRAKDGCEEVEVTTDAGDADHLLLVERWTTRKNYEDYLAWRQERGDLDVLGEMLAAPPTVRYFNPTDA